MNINLLLIKNKKYSKQTLFLNENISQHRLVRYNSE